MGAILFIAVFLASFLIGSGASYIYQTQPGANQPGSSIPTATPTPVPLGQECMPEYSIIDNPNPYQLTVLPDNKNGISVEATEDYPVNDINYIYDNMGPTIGLKDNYNKILLWLFGDELRGVPQGHDYDRRQGTWTLIKRDAAIPAWKTSDRSGHMMWSIPKCVWDSSYATCDANTNPVCSANDPDCNNVFFHEMTRIGLIDANRVNDSYLKDRYTKSNTSDAKGDVWVATGWCGGNNLGLGGQYVNNPGQYDSITSQLSPAEGGCTDPILRDLIFVVSKQGAGPRLGRSAGPPNPGDQGTDISSDINVRGNSWWRFDVYYNFRSQTVNSGNLPCWMKSCGRNPGPVTGPFDPNLRISDPQCNQASIPNKDTLVYNNEQDRKQSVGFFIKNSFTLLSNKIKKETSSLVNNILHLTPALAETLYPQFLSGQAISYDAALPDTEKQKIQPNTYIISTDVSLPSDPVFIGTFIYQTATYSVFASQSDLTNASASQPGLPSGLSTIYVVDAANPGVKAKRYFVVHSTKNQGETLKLETFYPPIISPTAPPVPPLPPTFTYEWYTPACKPAIYLYPKERTILSVFVKPQGYLTESIPLYENGWNNILADPSGIIQHQGKEYPYLYYEAEVKEVKASSSGWIVYKDNLPSFFDDVLPKLGLNEKEAKDFKDYWLTKLNDKPYYFVGLIDRNQLDNLEKIDFSQQPDTFIRVRMFFEGLNEYQSVSPLFLPNTPNRNGFVAVDWGGMIKGGSCNGGAIDSIKVQ